MYNLFKCASSYFKIESIEIHLAVALKTIASNSTSATYVPLTDHTCASVQLKTSILWNFSEAHIYAKGNKVASVVSVHRNGTTNATSRLVQFYDD